MKTAQHNLTGVQARPFFSLNVCRPRSRLHVMANKPVRFLELSIPERIASTQRAIAEGKTQSNLWVGFDTPPDWDERGALAAELLAGCPSIADFGAGYMHLEKFLRPEVSYYPVDFAARDNRTLVCDFNKSPAPATPARAAACLGLLEYVCDARAFISSIAPNYEICVLSYHPVRNARDEREIRSRRACGWMHDFDLVAFELLLADFWRVTQRHSCGENQFIWQLKAKKRLLPIRLLRKLGQRVASPTRN
jgi:hypothetical protein